MQTKSYHVRRITLLSICLLLVSGVLWAQVPDIASVSPGYGYAGQTVTITGSNFSASCVVTFGDARANVISRTSQIIQVEVPAHATFEHVKVTNTNGNSAFSPYPFILSFGGETGLSASDFSAEINQSTQPTPYDLVISDFNNDGKNDIIVTSAGSNSIQILQNNTTTVGAASPSFTASSYSLPSTATTLNITSADLNGDNKPEVILSEANETDPSSRVFILTNNSGASIGFAAAPYIVDIASSQTKLVDISDIDGDGKPDLIVSDQADNGKIYVLRNTSGGSVSFAAPVSLNLGSSLQTGPLLVDDLNNDGKPDIAASLYFTDGGGLFVFRNNSTPGNIQFGTVSAIAAAGTIVNLRASDINRDGKLDLIASRYLSSDVAYYLNTSSNGGALSFNVSASNRVAAGNRPWGLDLGDIDGDGFEDFVVGNSNAAVVSVLYRSAALSYQTLNLGVSDRTRNLKVGDLNMDGKPDIVFTIFAQARIGILMNRKCVTPVLNEEGPLTVCSSNPVDLETQEIPNATYTWLMDGAVQQTGADNTYTASTSGTHTYEVTLSQGTCAETSDPISIEVVTSSAASFAITPVDPVCIGGTATLQVTGNVSGKTFEWSGPDNFTSTSNPAQVSSFAAIDVGEYSVDIYDNSAGCLIATETVSVQSVDVPSFAVSASETASCQGNPITLTVSPYNTSDYSYQWANGSGNISGETGSTLSVNTPGTQEYYVKITDLNNGSCPDIESNSLEISMLSEPTASFSAAEDACTQQNVLFTNNSTVDANATVNYRWTFGDGAFLEEEEVGHSYGVPGTYDVILEVSYEGSTCSDTFTKEIEIIDDGLDVEIEASQNPMCFQEEVTLTLANVSDNYQIEWSTGETSNEITVSEAGNYSVMLVNTDNGCDNLGNITLDEYPETVVNITSDSVTVSPGSNVQLNATGLANYLWSPGSSLNDSTIANPIATVNQSETYTVEGTDNNGCYGMASIDLFIATDMVGNIIKPKNFFSPNSGDNINDLWVIEKIEQFPECAVTIIDQSGNLLYEAQPYNNDWDGTSNGQMLADGVYYYVIKCDGSKVTKSGSITILR
ncbi:FG-GAP-like repeat-containing protein [Fulvivirga maritima]|uniref:FG-GAP-like repeat-containing protein n=1 Tax=Fulvivirga maritima TaxID=2904247 RepID=UPI001F17AC89|nr:FG-GAP-like repeat-containing protein [Fulvivirga maritima]UII25928.1 FG-GAP-like repeat-containing protein [Fulvivirga maritima]